jgi:hypothetical protein
VALYNATDGDNWTNNTGWLSGDKPCLWYGVEDCTWFSVREIDLRYNNLNGTLPTEIENLTNLEILLLTRV